MYAVLQLTLDQPIGREALEKAVVATRSLVKPDCAVLERDLFGIVAGNLEHDEALGIQSALRAHGIETEVVDEVALPQLAAPKRAQAFRLTPAGLQVIEYTGQETIFDNSMFVFATAGHVKHLAARSHEELEWVDKWVRPEGPRRVVEMVKKQRIEIVPEFRLEFYFSREPYRLQWILDERSVLRANDEVIKLRHRDRLDVLMVALAKTLPADRVGQGIRRAGKGEEFVYPSVHAFEEEIIWSFYRLMRG